MGCSSFPARIAEKLLATRFGRLAGVSRRAQKLPRRCPKVATAAEVSPKLGQFLPVGLADVGCSRPTSANFDQTWPTLAKCWPIAAKIGPKQPHLARVWLESTKTCQTCPKPGRNLETCLHNVAKNCQFRPKVIGFGPSLARLRRQVAHIGYDWRNLGQISVAGVTFGQLWGGFRCLSLGWTR